MADKIDFEGIDSSALLRELDSRGDNVTIDDFDTQDIIDELEWQGYTVMLDSDVPVDIDDYDDDELILELQRRGFDVWSKKVGGNPDLLELYTTYQIMSPEFFEKELKKFFRNNLNVNIY